MSDAKMMAELAAEVAEKGYDWKQRAILLADTLTRAQTVLANMAQENEGAIFNRWPISHEPLRADAKALLPLINEVLNS